MNIAKIHKRLVAATIDLIIVLFLSFVVIYFFNSNYPYVEYDSMIRESQYKSRGFLLGLLVDFSYTTYLMQQQMQATLGMKAMGLKIVNASGGKPELGALLLRYFVSIFSSILLKLGYLYAIFNQKNQTVHDYVAGTIIIDEDEELGVIFKDSQPHTKAADKDFSSIEPTKNYSSTYHQKNDEQLWEAAIDEYDSSMRKKGLYAKIYSQKNGNESLIKAEYIKERFEQLKEEEIEKTKTKSKIDFDYNRNQSAEQSIASGLYTLKKVRGIDCLLFENGQAAIKVGEQKYRLYEDDASLEKSMKYYAGSGMYLTTGLIRVVELGEEKIILSCPRCKQKTKVPKNKELEISCPSCEFKWIEKT